MLIIPVMERLNLQQPLLQFCESHDPSEIILIRWFSALEIFHLIINVENNCAA